MIPRLAIILLVVAAVFVDPAAALTTIVSESGFTMRLWQVEDGLPQNTVVAIAQTKDRYLWLGTYDGLSRFDGARFQNFDATNTPELPDAQILALFEDKNERLWIGHDSGALTCYKQGRFERVGASQVGVGQNVIAIDSDREGSVWVLRKNGVMQCATDGRIVRTSDSGGVPGRLNLVRDEAGDLYVLNDGRLVRLSAGVLSDVELDPAEPSDVVIGIGSAGEGGLWIVRSGRVRRWHEGKWVEDRGLCPWGDSPITSVVELEDRSLAVGTTDRGCYMLFANGKMAHFDQNNGLAQNWVRKVYQDFEGSLWLGIGSAGLVMIKSTPFSVVNPPDRWRGHTVLSVEASVSDALWIGTEGAGLYHYDHGRWLNFDREQGLAHPYVWSVTEDGAGRVWVGTWNRGLQQYLGGAFVAVEGLPQGPAPVIAVEATPDHGLLVSHGADIFKWKDGVSSLFFESPKESATNICDITHDASGAVWFGMSGGGLGHVVAGKLSIYRRKDGLPSDRVNCLYAEPGGTLWIGTADGGLCRLRDGRFSIIGVAQGFGSNVVCHIADDGAGFLWFSTHHGLFRVAKDELNRCADGLSARIGGQVFDRSDGLPTIEFSGGLKAAGSRTSDGRLWFTSSKGLLAVDPGEIRTNRAPPPVIFESLMVDGRLIESQLASPADLQLVPDHQRLEFRYTALSLVAPSKVKFRYRLVGLDRDWVEVENKRSAHYSQLPYGEYRFEVIACNNDGVWNNEGAHFSFTVLPYYWQTWWFRGLLTLALSFAIGAGVRTFTRRRMQRRIAVLQQEHAIERERTRIAQDLHDEIGASLTRITLLSQSIRPSAIEANLGEALLQQISETARGVTQSVEEIVWALAPRHDTLESLVCYMAKFGQDFLAAAKVRCRLDLPVTVPGCPLGADARHNLFLAFKEALNNAVKHAAATEVAISLQIKPATFVLTVQDNGRGMDGIESGEGSAQPTHRNGLTNLRRRLQSIGGSCEISSRPGGGTTVTLTCPFKLPENTDPSSNGLRSSTSD